MIFTWFYFSYTWILINFWFFVEFLIFFRFFFWFFNNPVNPLSCCLTLTIIWRFCFWILWFLWGDFVARHQWFNFFLRWPINEFFPTIYVSPLFYMFLIVRSFPSFSVYTFYYSDDFKYKRNLQKGERKKHILKEVVEFLLEFFFRFLIILIFLYQKFDCANIFRLIGYHLGTIFDLFSVKTESLSEIKFMRWENEMSSDLRNSWERCGKIKKIQKFSWFPWFLKTFEDFYNLWRFWGLYKDFLKIF